MIATDWLVVALCVVGLAACAIPLLPARKAKPLRGWIHGSLSD